MDSADLQGKKSMEGSDQTEEKDVDTTGDGTSVKVNPDKDEVTESQAQVIADEGTSVDPDSESDGAMHTPPESTSPIPVTGTENNVIEQATVTDSEPQSQTEIAQEVKPPLATGLSTLSLVSETDQEVAAIMKPEPQQEAQPQEEGEQAKQPLAGDQEKGAEEGTSVDKLSDKALSPLESETGNAFLTDLSKDQEGEEDGDETVIVMQGTSVDIPGYMAEAKEETGPTVGVEVKVDTEDSEDTLSDVMEPSPRMELPTRMVTISVPKKKEDDKESESRLDLSAGTSELIAGAADQMVPRLEGIGDEDDESFSEALAPRKTSEKKPSADTYKNDVDQILAHYRKQWGTQKEAEEKKSQVFNPYEVEGEVIDDVLAEEDSESNNTTSTSALFEESFSQLSQVGKPDTEGERKERTTSNVSVKVESIPQRITTTTTTTTTTRVQRLQNASQSGVNVATGASMTTDIQDISISSSSTISDAESQLTDDLVQDVGPTHDTFDDLVSEIQLKSQRSTGITIESLNSAVKQTSKLPDEDNKSDSGVSDSTLSKGSLEDLMAYDYTDTQLPRSTMKNLLSLGSYEDKLPKRSTDILAYPVYGAAKKAEAKEKETKQKQRQAKSVTFDMNGDEVDGENDGSNMDPSVLEGQEIINRFNPSTDADVLTKVTKTLEDSVLRDADSLTLRGAQAGDPPTKVPAKVRDIITKNLSTEDLTLPEPGRSMSSVGSDHVREENRMLQTELNRVEDLLAASRAERDEIGIKYNALSERLEQSLQLDKGEVGRGEDPNAKSLVTQNVELRRKLEEEHSGYKRKLQAYQEGQQRQAQLVQKLQAKVLQYKRKCGDLEEQVRSQQGEMNRKSLQSSDDSLRYRLDSAEQRLRASEADHHMDLETALIKLEEEQQRSSSLAHVNAMLREQLDQATSANQQLTADIHKLTQDWTRAREELEHKEAEWREEEQSFNEYFSNEHSRLLHLWRAVVAFRRQFSEMKSSTERDLTHLRSDVTRASRGIHSACLNLSANTRNSDTQSQVSLDNQRVSFESQLREKVREVIDLQAKFDAQSAELNARINELTAVNERLRGSCDEKERSMASMQRQMAQVEGRLGERGEEVRQLAHAKDMTTQERDDIDAMHEALRRIAAEVISDADQSLRDDSGDPELSTKVLRPESPIRSMSPSRAGRRTPSPRRGRSLSPSNRSPTFADSTFSAVQAALSKRQLQVCELRAKLTSQREQNSAIRKTTDDVDNERRKLEQTLLQVKEQRDTAVRAQQDAQRTSDRTKTSLGMAETERTQLERVRHTLNEQIDALTAENSKLQAANAEIQHQRDLLEDEKEDVTKDKERQMKENERTHKVIEQCEAKISKLKEDLVNTKECLNRALLEKDVLEQERAEVSEALSRAEMCKAELELEINKVKTEEASLRDALLKMQALNEGLGQDKIELNKIIMQIEAEKQHVHAEKGAVEQEKFGLKEELVRVEQEKLDVENDRAALNHSLNMAEQNREKLEAEIMGLNRERAELIEQLNAVSRQKNALAEELLSARKEIERQSDTIVRIAKEKEELTRDRAELSVQLTASERENRQQSELISGLKSDKEALECTVHETQGVNATLETRKEQLEGENQELILKKEHLQGEVARERKEHALSVEKLEKQKDNLNVKLAQTEKDLQLALRQEQQAHEEDIERLSKEKESQRIEMESQRDEIIHQNNMEKEEMVTRYEREQEQLNDEMNSLQRDRDEQLLLAENDKQQVMSLLEQEKASLQEKLANVNNDLETANMDYEKLKREAVGKQEADRNTILNLQGELKGFRDQFEETCVAHEKEVKDMNNALRELDRHKEGALREVAELKVQLKMVEETRDTIRRDLIDANRTIREAEEVRELMRKDVVDLKRNVNEEIHEKEAVQQTAHELRNNVKRLEGEKTELSRIIQEAKQRIGVLEEQKAGVQKEASDLRSSLREVEKARLDARRELQDLRRQVKMLDGERNKLGQEVGELQSRVAHDEQKEEESRRENFGLKQKVVETEASREALRKELANLQRKMAEFEDEARLKEKDYQLALEDSRRLEKKLDDQRRNLEISLENANAELADLKLKLSGSEGRVNALEAQLARTEGYKREIEFKLSSIVSSLRRTVGLRERMPRSASPLRSRSPSPRRSRPSSPTKGFENTYTTTTDGRGSPIPRTGSPSRSLSPYRSMSPSRMMEQQVSAADVDPEVVRASLRDFVQQLASSERERDDAMAQTRSVTIQLKEMEEDRDRTEARLQKLQRSLGEAEEGKKDIDSRLASAQTALMLQEETIRRNERERKTMNDKICNLERNLVAAETDKRQQQERIQKMKNNEAKLEEDKKNLRANLDDAENRVTKGELARRSLEGDLQRMKLALNDKETENQVLQDRANNVIRQMQDLEDRGQSLQTTIDRLSHALSKSEENEHSHKDKVSTLNCTLSDTNAQINEMQDRTSQLQRALTSSEHDRRVLQERLDNTRSALNEAKKQNHSLIERVQGLQNELSDNEVRRAEVETQLRSSHVALVQRQEAEQELNQRVQKLQGEKGSMAEKLAALQRNLANIETEKREVERSAVRMEKDKSALKKTLDKVEREKMKNEEMMTRSSLEKTSLDRTLGKLEDDNKDFQNQVQQLQQTLANLEQEHSSRLIDLTTRHRHETEMETERLRSAQLQAERMLEARERAHRQRIKGLEEQIATLKDQLGQEMRKRQQFISRSVKAGEEVADIRSMLDTSLGKVAYDPELDPILLEQETKKLDEDLGYRGGSSMRVAPRRRSPGRGPSPTRLGRITSTPVAGRSRRHVSPVLRRP